MTNQSKALTRVLPLFLAGLLWFPGSAPADQADPSQGSGQATTEVEHWQAQIAESGRRVAAFQDQILDLRNVFRRETQHLRNARAEFSARPSEEARRHLQRATADSLTALAEATGEIISERDDILNQALAVEDRARDRAAHYRRETEAIDRTMPERQAALAKLEAKNDSLKERYANDPGNQELHRLLRQAFREERVQSHNLKLASQHSSLLGKAAVRFDEMATRTAHIHGALEDVFDSVGFAHRDARENAKLLLAMIEIDEELQAFTGGVKMAEFFETVGSISGVTEDLGRAMEEAMMVGLGPTVEPLGGSLPEADSEFSRWLNSRQDD